MNFKSKIIINQKVTKMKKFLSMLVLSLALLSCNKQEVYEPITNNVITIYLNSQTITRSAAKSSSPTRSALVSDPKSVENTVNSVTIAVFKSDGTLRTLKEFSSPSKSVTMKVANLTTSDKVVCVANAKSGTFASIKTLEEFNAKEVSLDDALTTNGVDIIASNLLMYGSGSIIADKDGFISNVDMYHINSKISLNSLTITIPNGGIFKPKEIFLINVPAQLKYSYDNPYSTIGTYLHGSLNSSIQGESQKLYLGYGNINSAVNKLFFYSSPNNSVKHTKIVIFGSYDQDGNGPLQAKDTYYPIMVDKNMLPNKNYMLNITIKGVGVDSPTDDLNYSNFTVTLNVNNFDDISKDISLD